MCVRPWLFHTHGRNKVYLKCRLWRQKFRKLYYKIIFRNSATCWFFFSRSSIIYFSVPSLSVFVETPCYLRHQTVTNTHTYIHQLNEAVRRNDDALSNWEYSPLSLSAVHMCGCMCVCCLLIVPLHLAHVDKKLCKVNMPVCVLQFSFCSTVLQRYSGCCQW